MFTGFMTKVRRWLYKVGLIKGIEKVSSHKNISLNDEMFNKIEVWKALYSGYYSEIHDIEYKTIAGTKNRKMESLGMPKVVSSEMASLIFNEKCEISISDEDTSEYIDSVLEDNSFYKKFQDFLEFALAIGGMVVKPYVKNKTQLALSYVTAENFIPLSWHNDRISEAVFPSEYRKGDKKYTHLEWHQWEGEEYLVKNELYESTGEELGVKVSLDILFPNLDEEVRIKGLKRPLFVYFKPNTANNIDTYSPLGISVFANAIDTIKAIDIAFDSFIREFRLGKKRIIVPSTMIRTVIDPETGEQHRYFDSTDETYEAFSAGEMDSDTIQDISVELRVDEHISAINALLNLLAMQTGFSAGTFSFDGQSVKTATEVISENSKTFKSKKSHEIIIEAGLQELVQSIVELAKLYKLFKGSNEFEVTVSFDDSIVEDENAEITKQIQLVTNKLTSRKKAIMKIHGLTEEDAIKLIQEIDEENATATAQAVDFFGITNSNNNSNSNSNNENNSNGDDE